MAIHTLDAARGDERHVHAAPVTAVDVLICGAGPAGSALGASLARAGATVLIVEAAEHPRP